jgi:hypothetical protein
MYLHHSTVPDPHRPQKAGQPAPVVSMVGAWPCVISQVWHRGDHAAFRELARRNYEQEEQRVKNKSTDGGQDVCLRYRREQLYGAKCGGDRTGHEEAAAAAGAVSSQDSESGLANDMQQRLHVMTTTVAVDPEAVKLLRGLEKEVKHLTSVGTNYCVRKVLDEAPYTPAQRELIMSINKSPTQLGREVHNRQQRIAGYSTRCIRKPTGGLQALEFRVIIGLEEYGLVIVKGKNCSYYTYYLMDDLRRWKVLTDGIAEQVPLVHYVDVDKLLEQGRQPGKAAPSTSSSPLQ